MGLLHLFSQIEPEADKDSPCCSKETLRTSYPKYLTKLEAKFTSDGGELSAPVDGGELSAPVDSNVRIIVPKGAIPAGTNQSVFFGVFLDEIPLLQDIPKEPDNTLISPVVERGPHDINLPNPVEIIVPHCLCLSKAKKKWIKVYRCGNFVAGYGGEEDFFFRFTLVSFFLNYRREVISLTKISLDTKRIPRNPLHRESVAANMSIWGIGMVVSYVYRHCTRTKALA